VTYDELPAEDQARIAAALAELIAAVLLRNRAFWPRQSEHESSTSAPRNANVPVRTP
jgi:hypothetical protein